MIKQIFRFAIIGAIFLGSAGIAQAAELYIDTTKKDLNLGDTIIANVRVRTTDECINIASVDIHYDNTKLDVVDFSQGESLITLWIENPVIDKDAGTVHFSGGIPGGYCGRVIGDPELSNILGRIIYTTVADVVEPGQVLDTTVSIATSSQILLNDGLGTPADLTAGSVGLTLTYTGGAIVNDWLQSIRADAIAPEAFDISVQRNDAMFAGKYFITFSTIDKQTGVNHYEILETNPSLFGFDIITNRKTHWKEVESPYMLWDQSVSSRVLVKAIDEAGNERIATFDPPGHAPLRVVVTEVLQLLVIAGLIGGFGYLIYRNVRGVRREEYEETEKQGEEDTEQ